MCVCVCVRLHAAPHLFPPNSNRVQKKQKKGELNCLTCEIQLNEPIHRSLCKTIISLLFAYDCGMGFSRRSPLGIHKWQNGNEKSLRIWYLRCSLCHLRIHDTLFTREIPLDKLKKKNVNPTPTQPKLIKIIISTTKKHNKLCSTQIQTTDRRQIALSMENSLHFHFFSSRQFYSSTFCLPQTATSRSNIHLSLHFFFLFN